MHTPSFTIDGSQGRIECIIKEPGHEPRFAAAVCHPHPQYGGTMHNKVTYRTASSLVAAGGAAVRFNFRGVGRSAGEHDAGRGEGDDLTTVIDYLVRGFPDLPVLVAGFSFGAWVGLTRGAADGRVRALIGIGLATSVHDYAFLRDCHKPKLFVQGGADEFGPLSAVQPLVEALPLPRELVVVDDADHLFTAGTAALEAAVERFARELFDGPPAADQ